MTKKEEFVKERIEQGQKQIKNNKENDEQDNNNGESVEDIELDEFID